jgi:hypothetical protein
MTSQPCFYASQKLDNINQFIISSGFILKIEEDFFYILDKKTSEIIKIKAEYCKDDKKNNVKVKNIICYEHNVDIMKSDWYLSLGDR